MKSILTAIALTLTATFAWAGNDTSTKHAKLLGYFEQGTVSLAAEIEGAWSGRCYEATAPDTALPMVLMVKTVGGFTGVTLNLAAGHHPWDKSSDPARYDELSDSDREALLNFQKSEVFFKLVSRVEDGSLVSTNEAGNLQFHVRKHGSYFFYKDTILQDSGGYKAGNVFSACYFFKKVLD